jgi:hypothetical protein
MLGQRAQFLLASYGDLGDPRVDRRSRELRAARPEGKARDRYRRKPAFSALESSAQSFEIPDQFGRLLMPMNRILGQQASEEGLDSGRQIAPELCGGLRVLGKDSAGIGRSRGESEGQPAGQQLVEDNSQRPEIGSMVHGVTLELFGRHVGHGTDDGPFPREPGPVGLEGDPEIDDLDLPRGGEDEVGRLDVPVDDAVSVGVSEAGSRLRGPGESRVEIHESPRDLRLEGLALAEPHRDEEVALVVLCGLVDRADVGMIERRGGTGLLEEALPADLIPAIGQEELERYETLE